MINFTLPYPRRELNPNVVRHFHQKAKIKAQARTIGYELSKQHFGYFADNVRLKVIFTVHKGSAHKYDLDNVIASLKAVCDGVFDGIGCNDNQIDKIAINRGDIDRQNPRVELIIEELTSTP